MKKLLTILLSLTLLISCNLDDPFGIKAKEEKAAFKKKLQEEALLVQLLHYNTLIEPSDCRNYSGQQNQLYFVPTYSLSFLSDTKQYRMIIIGDSTMDISHRYANWYDPSHTQVVAVAGNTMCDMTEQMKVINTVDPTFVMVATNGGNDILHGLTEAQALQNAKYLSDRISQRFPNAIQVWVGVHPTVTAYNNTKQLLNADVKAYILAKANTMYYNPLPLFVGVCDTCQPPMSDMLDNIHYNETISFDLKHAIESLIGESF